VHHLALDECVNRKKMCNFYNGNAFEGCIRNVPVVQDQEQEQEEAAMVLAVVDAAQCRRKRRRLRQ